MTEIINIRGSAAVGERLAISRKVFNLNQREFASKAGIAQNTYNQYENGKSLPSLSFANLICDTYGLTLDWIFRGDPSCLPFHIAEKIYELQKTAFAPILRNKRRHL